MNIEYQIKFKIIGHIFKPGYPLHVNTLGDLIRTVRMDLNLEIKQLAKHLGICDQSIINIEMNKNQSSMQTLKKIVPFLKSNLNGTITEKEFWSLCFKKNPSYPAQQITLGEKLRAARMKKFLSIRQLAKELKVDPTSINKWELGKTKPLPEYEQKITDRLYS